MGVSAFSREISPGHAATQFAQPMSVITARGTVKPLPCLTCPAKAANICKSLDYDRQKDLFELGHPRKWEQRQFLFRAGGVSGPVFKITSGMVAVSTALADGRRQIVALYLSGDICGHSEIEGKYAYDGEAIGTVTACAFDRPRFKAFVERHPDVADAMTRVLEEKLARTRRHLTVIGQLTSTERVANFLLMLSAAYSEHGFQVRPLSMPMKRSDVSDYLGLRIETVSRAFTKLRKQRLVDLDDDRIVILDPVRLSHLGNAMN